MARFSNTVRARFLVNDHQWDAHVNGSKHLQKVHEQFKAERPAPSCKCGVKSSLLTVRKDGPNQGREFYTCGNDRKCKFFQWAGAPVIEAAATKPSCLISVTLKPGAAAHVTAAGSDAAGGSDELPGKIKDILPHYEITVADDGGAELDVRSPWNKSWLEAFKEHVPGRRWNGDSKIWTVSRASAPALARLVRHMGMEMPEVLETAASGGGCGGGGGAASADALELEICATARGDVIALDVPYNATLIRIVKQLHPGLRQFDWDRKVWAVAAGAMEQQLLPMLHGDDEVKSCRVPTMLDGLLHDAVRHAACKRKAEDETADDFEAALKRSKDPSAASRRTSQGHRVSASAEEHHHPDCRCGHPEQKINGKHVCRMFGKFHCKSCGNGWSSAYCWFTPETSQAEKQACRRCQTENAPQEMRKLGGGHGSNISGAHDSSKCGMCKKLGRDCSELRRSMGRGFAAELY